MYGKRNHITRTERKRRGGSYWMHRSPPLPIRRKHKKNPEGCRVDRLVGVRMCEKVFVSGVHTSTQWKIPTETHRSLRNSP